tara:strand:- start:151 stop:474 length:324 start_codon:yes stop_codon:yes gene_type:complete
MEQHYDEVVKNTPEERRSLAELMSAGLNLDEMIGLLKSEYSYSLNCQAGSPAGIRKLEDDIRELLQVAFEERLEDDGEFIQEYDEYIPPGCDGDREVRRLYIPSEYA